MRKTNKKGFTIVELVIVIAVIAVLAGVLIPTFSGVVDKANKSAALQTARSTLANALSMSSTATLQGTDDYTGTNNYHTVFVIDGTYAYGYNGNELEAINYPTDALTSGAEYKIDLGTAKTGKGYNKNFNAIIVSTDNLTAVTSDFSVINSAGICVGSNGNASSSYTVSSSGNFVLSSGGELVSAADGDYQTGNYRLSLEISKAIASVSDFTIDDGATVGFTVTKSGDTYTVWDGSGHSAALYVNSDFAKGVAVFTCFAN